MSPNMVNNGFCHPSFRASTMTVHVPGIPPSPRAIKHCCEHPSKTGRSCSNATSVFNHFEPNKLHSEKHSASLMENRFSNTSIKRYPASVSHANMTKTCNAVKSKKAFAILSSVLKFCSQTKEIRLRGYVRNSSNSKQTAVHCGWKTNAITKFLLLGIQLSCHVVAKRTNKVLRKVQIIGETQAETFLVQMIETYAIIFVAIMVTDSDVDVEAE